MSTRQKTYSKQDISQRLVHFRERILDATQFEFALAMGLPIRTLQSYEQCKADVSLELLVRLHERYGIDPMWLLRGIGEAPGDSVKRDITHLVKDAATGVALELEKRGGRASPEKYGAFVALVFKQLQLANGDMRKVNMGQIIDLAS